MTKVFRQPRALRPAGSEPQLDADRALGAAPGWGFGVFDGARRAVLRARPAPEGPSPSLASRPASTAIELQVPMVRRLFHALDPLPYRQKDLDPQVEAYIVEWARELARSETLDIRIHLPAAEIERPAARQVEAAMQAYFGGRAAAMQTQIRDLLRTGRASLVIGLSVLAICMVAARIVADLVPGDLGRFLGEGLVILGWVANWRPIEIFLYDWWPLVRRRGLYERLSRCRVLLEASAEGGTEPTVSPGPIRVRTT